jgi:hypothetical protein
MQSRIIKRQKKGIKLLFNSLCFACSLYVLHSIREESANKDTETISYVLIFTFWTMYIIVQNVVIKN